jgi:lysophospholipase L1-like esterase
MTGLEITNKGTSGATCETWYEQHNNDDLRGYKACFIALGINDTIKKENGWDNDSDTAITQIVQKVRNESGENIPIFIATIPDAYHYTSGLFEATNTRIRSIANTLNAYIVDLGANNNIVYNFHINGGHPNSYGYYEIAKEWRAYVSYIIATHNSKFTNLQFVGTDYNYN